MSPASASAADLPLRNRGADSTCPVQPYLSIITRKAARTAFRLPKAEAGELPHAGRAPIIHFRSVRAATHSATGRARPIRSENDRMNYA